MTASPATRTGQHAPASQSHVASLDEIRSCFPALARIHNGLPVAYFDGPGGTQVPLGVTEAMSDYLLHHNANTAWAYPTSEETDAMLAAAYSSSHTKRRDPSIQKPRRNPSSPTVALM